MEERSDERKEWQRNYYKANRERLIQQSRDYYKKNRDQYLTYGKKYWAENKEDVTRRRKGVAPKPLAVRKERKQKEKQKEKQDALNAHEQIFLQESPSRKENSVEVTWTPKKPEDFIVTFQ